MGNKEKKQELECYIGKNVRIVLRNGTEYVGKVDGTSDAEDNQRPVNSIEIWFDGKGYGFYKDEIQEINIL